MKALSVGAKINGFTLVELLAAIAVIAILAAILLPASSNRHRRLPGLYCVNNQKQIASGLIMFRGENNEKLPWQVPASEGGSMEFVTNNSVAPHFQVFSNYFSKQTGILVCPSDTNRQAAVNFASLTSTNVSYFLNLDVTTNANSILSGDRLMEFNGTLIHSGIFIQSTNVALTWSTGLHKTPKTSRGIFSFSDGHVQAVTASQLNDVLQKQPLATNRFCFP